MRRALIASGVLFSCTSLLLAQALFNKPVKVAGDPNFIGTAASPTAIDTLGPNYVEGRELNSPQGIALDNSVSPPIVYIADTGNHRVLGYRYATQLVAGAHADIVIGQVDFYTNGPQNPANGGRQAGLNNPSGVAVDSSGNLYVADTGNNRILRFPQPFNSANANQQPNLVIGQKTFGTSTVNLNGLGASTLALNVSGARSGLTLDASGNLWVSDTGNSRVLRFPAATLATGAPFPAADLLLGQATFTTVPNNSTPSRTNLATLAGPCGIAFDASGNLYVTDLLFRVMVYNAPFTNGQPANAALGVDSTVSASTPTQIALYNPLGVVFPGPGTNFGPIVADTFNHRLMLYPPQTNWPSQGTQFSPSATSQIGQPSFTANKANQGKGDASSSTFNFPVDMAATSTELYVVDNGNNRVLVFPYGSTTSVGPAATRVIGQLDFPYTGKNLVDGKGFSFAAGGFPAGAVLDTSATPAHLYVPDTLNNRVLGYKDFTGLQDGQAADLVIGQPDFNRSVINYPSGDVTTPTASSLNLPTSLAVDSAGNLFVTDTGNSRVLRFPAPFASGTTKLESADLVLGQSGFTSYITDATSATLNSPVGIALTSGAANAASTSGFLVVSDFAQNRVLFFAKPFTSGMTASIVLGQSNMTASAPGGAGTGLNSPRAVAVDPQDRVLVADSGNQRVQIFDQAGHLSTFAAATISLGGFASPTGVSVGPSGDFWVADFTGNRMYHYPPVSALPLANDASDASFTVIGPHSGFVDPFNNLLVTDGISRLLYFTAQVSYQNAANYSSRPLAAGTIVALYPTLTTNSIAEGTASAAANQFPMLTTLADTEVTVNGTPVPLYFVSPGQDNIILPQGLPTAGTANLLVVRPSTGQILGATELPLQTSSPALFTNPPIGSGQLLAVNVQDGSTNSGTHPVTRGQFVILYGTGVGPVPSPPADGAAATGQPADDLPKVFIQSSGGAGVDKLIPCYVNFSGLAPGFAGLWQINVQIPNNAQSGSAVVLELFEKDIPNLDQSSALTTTIAVN